MSQRLWAQMTERSNVRIGRVARILVTVLMVGLFVGSGKGSAADTAPRTEGPRVNVSTEPARVHPNSEFVTVRVTVQDLSTSSSSHAVKLSLDAPSSTWLSTDFPVVEGTRLLDLNTQLNDESFEFHYRFPIRGSYNLNLKVFEREGDRSSPIVESTRTIQVSEHPSDLRNASLLFVGLFLLGLVLGYVIRRTALRENDTSSGGTATATGLVVLIAFTGMSMPSAYGHGPDAHESHVASDLPERDQNEHGTLQVDVSTTSPSVGELMTVNARYSDSESSSTTSARFVVECVNLEEGFTVFRMTTVEDSGRLNEQIQFVDGAPHQVRVTAEPMDHHEEETDQEGGTLVAGSNVDVTAIQPPTGVVVRMMGILLGVFVIGLFGGYLCHVYATASGSGSSSDQMDSTGE